ncbi:hypothetical protein Scep_027243 [Stephania cephalantha]|uniref:Uncharacterized protein n=1 Tax=Stephania cephalantha TaxID=152367 RepID=A0AAP0E7M5_9MAGN
MLNLEKSHASTTNFVGTANFAGNTNFSLTDENEWILDTCASDNMTSQENFFSSQREISQFMPIKVPDGSLVSTKT